MLLTETDESIRKGFELSSFLREEVMHQPIRDNLEEYLKGSTRKVPQEFHAHLVACEECASELRLLETQAKMLRSLQPDGDLDPRAGFYARVMERVEAGRTARSIWSVFLQPNFGRRLAMASAVLVMLLGTYLVTTEAERARSSPPRRRWSPDASLADPSRR